MLLLLQPSAFAEDPPPWGPVDATYVVHVPAEGPLTVELTWHLLATRPGWWEAPLAGPGLVVADVTGPAVATPTGLLAALAPGQAATIVARGTLDPTAAGSATLAILPAPRQHVVIDAPGLDVEVAGALDGWLAGADTLSLSWRPHLDAAPAAPAPLTRAEAATAVWAEAGALVSRTRARWHVLRGEVARFELDVRGLDEVEATGPNLASATRQGDRLVLVPRSPVRGTFEVDVRARAVLPEGDTDAPGPRPIAGRVERFWTVGRAEDGELVPAGGPRSVPLRAVPEWGRGLSETPLESAWAGDQALRVRVARFSPLMGPDTVIERAEIVVAAAREGRALIRTTWDVRNERRQYLHVTPPPGLRPMTARVSGVAALVLSDGAGGLYVPLEKSVETVQGLLTFPVEITWMAEGQAWDPKGERTLTVPAVDAPIQDARWQVYLPRGATAKGAHPAAPPPEEPAGGEELQQAVNAYKNNDFEQAQQWLDHAKASGNDSANVDRLQSNLDVLLQDGKDEDDAPEDVSVRRVRSLANAKTVTLQVEQEKKAEEARKAYERGDVEEAERTLEEVIVLSGKIGKTEQKESAEQADKLDEANELLATVKKAKQERGSFGISGSGSGGGGSASGMPGLVAIGSGDDTSGDRDADGLPDPYVDDGEGLPDDVEGGVEGGQVGGVLGRAAGSAPVQTGPTSTTTRDALEEVSAHRPPPELLQLRDSNDREDLGVDEGREFSATVPAATATTTAPTPIVTDPVTGTFSTNFNYDAIEVESTTRRPAAKPAKVGAKGRAKTPVVTEIEYEDTPAPAFPEAPPAPPPAAGDFAGLRAEPEKPADFRAPLEVQAAPLTLALPLGGLLVEERAALLPAGAAPTLTVPYHFTRDAR